MGNILINFASCCNSQSACRTRSHLDTSEIEIPDKSEELSAHDGSVYRSCVGILLFLSPDLPQCQYVIRYLSTFSSKPTQKTMFVLKHLVGYLAGHADQHVSLRWKGIHSGILKDYEW